MIDLSGFGELPDPVILGPDEDPAPSTDSETGRAEVLHRMSLRFGQRIEKARGASRAYLKLLE